MAKPKGAPNPFEASHASYPGPLGALPARLPATIWALRSSCSSGTPAGSIATTAGSAASALTSAALRLEELCVHAGHGQVGSDLVSRRARASRRASSPGAARHGLDRHAAAATRRARPCRPGAAPWRRAPPDRRRRARSRGREHLPPRARCIRSGRRSRGRSRPSRGASRATPPSPAPRTARARAPRRARARPCPQARAAQQVHGPPASSTLRMSSRRMAPAPRKSSSSSPAASTSVKSL